MTPDETGGPPHKSWLDQRLAVWVHAELLSCDQAADIAQWENHAHRGTSSATPTAITSSPDEASIRQRRQGTLIEALAYVGGAIVAAAATILIFSFYEQLSTAIRILIPAGIAAGTLIAGMTIPQQLGRLGSRMRAALWLATVVAVGGLILVIAEVTDLSWSAGTRLLTGVMTVVAVILWTLHRSVVQHCAAFAAVAGLVAALDGGEALSIGLWITALASGWAMLSITEWLPGQTKYLVSATGPTHRIVGVRIAAAGASFAALILSLGWEQPWVALIPVALLVVAAIVLTDVPLVSVSAATGVVVIPIVADFYFSSTLTTALALLAAGGALITLAIVIARRRHTAEVDIGGMRQ